MCPLQIILVLVTDVGCGAQTLLRKISPEYMHFNLPDLTQCQVLLQSPFPAMSYAGELCFEVSFPALYFICFISQLCSFCITQPGIQHVFWIQIQYYPLYILVMPFSHTLWCTCSIPCPPMLLGK